MCGYVARFQAAILLIVIISRTNQRECRTEKRQVVMSGETHDVILTFIRFRHIRYRHYDSRIFMLERNNRHLAQINGLFDEFRRYETVSLNVTYYDDIFQDDEDYRTFRDPRPIASVIVTLHDVRESDSGEYVLHSMYSRIAYTCWTLYILEGKLDDYLEDGAFLNFTTLPSLSEETAARMNVTTSWLIDDKEIDPGQPRLVERSMDNKNLKYLIHEQSNNTITYPIGILKVAYTGPVVLEPKQDIYVLTTEDSLPAIRCNATCNPGCNTTWYRGPNIVSNTDILASEFYPDDVMIEFVCHVTNTYTSEQLTARAIVFRKENYPTLKALTEEASQIPVYLLAAGVGILTVTTVVLATCLCRHVTCLRKAADKDDNTVAMNDVTPDNSPANQYEALKYPNSAENMYEGIATDDQNTDRQIATDIYENT